MKKTMRLIAASTLLTLPFFTFAGGVEMPPAKSGGFFLGLGGAYNSVSVKQNLSAIGVGSILVDGVQVVQGTAGGSATAFYDTQTQFAPEGQVGYFQYFSNDQYLWGIKYFYEYLGTMSTNKGDIVPQNGTNTTFNGGQNAVMGHVVISSVQLRTSQEMALMPFIGRAFAKSNVYFGVGPALFNVQTKINRATGFALINGSPADITGTPANLSNSKWIWGGAFQIGVDYFLDPTWFVDFNYTLGLTQNFKHNYSGPYNTSTNAAGFTVVSTGTAFVNTSQYNRVQGVAISINKVF